jgi:hypothetical protein
MKRANPHKGWKWMVTKYFKRKTEFGFNNKWVFHSRYPGLFAAKVLDIELLELKWFKQTDHVIVRNKAIPDDREWKDYVSLNLKSQEEACIVD